MLKHILIAAISVFATQGFLNLAFASGVETNNAKKLQGRVVSTTAPSNGQVLGWNASRAKWEPVTGGGGGFDALSPMTTSGDIIYGGASGTGTRLAKGADGKVLVLASGVPSWGTVTGAGVDTMATIGSSPNSNGATISSTTLNLEPADATHGGVLSDPGVPQVIGGVKQWTGGVTYNDTFYITTPYTNATFMRMLGGTLLDGSWKVDGFDDQTVNFQGINAGNTVVSTLLFQRDGGNMGIGITGIPSAKLHVLGTVRFASFGAGAATFDASGNISSASDERLKEQIKPYECGLDCLKGLVPKFYHWNKSSGMDTENEYLGFIAQDVEKVIPAAVGTSPNGYKNLSDRAIIATLVNAVNESRDRIEALEKSLSMSPASKAKPYLGKGAVSKKEKIKSGPGLSGGK